ncbi:MAG TPA: pyridoxamine 5'-phosphate oxidase family protein [Gaiellaceae bacterium]|jgi:nitroimidazol reductase NimA-like FMN-containing flavoprotein (pyridoxamine 5'-phosphate oxidase superfamily)
MGTAETIIEANQFMTLATADAEGVPWASPVWYAHAGYREFFWVSSPEARHSRNLAGRPEVGIVIFDSHLTGGGNAVYLTAVAGELVENEVARAIEIYSRRSVAQGFPAWTRDDVVAPARHRLYRAVAAEHFVLDDHDERQAVDIEPA